MKLFSGGSKTVWVGQGSGQVPRRRANWIRRGIAVALDQVVVMVALLLVGLPAYVVTNGRIQSGGLPSAECVTLAEMPVGMSLPSGIRVKTIDACETNLLGVIVGSTLSVNFDAVEGMNLTTGLTWPRDREGRVVSGILLPVLFLPAFVLWRALTDSRGRQTLGRKLTRTEVMTLQSERPSLRVSLARQALNLGPLAIGMPPFVWSADSLVPERDWLERDCDLGAGDGADGAVDHRHDRLVAIGSRHDHRPLARHDCRIAGLTAKTPLPRQLNKSRLASNSESLLNLF